MSRRLRFIPEGGALVEVTCRALHSRLLFRPSSMVNQIIIGTLARAKQRHKVRVCFFVCASNHMLCAAPHNICYGECSVMWSGQVKVASRRGSVVMCCT